MSLSVHIRKKLDHFLLRVDLEHEAGVTGLLGASGCGKSMTLKCIAGIEKPDEGRIVLNGRVLFDSREHIYVKPQKRRVGYLFQNYALFPHMTVEKNILCGLSREKERDRRRQKLEEALALMELADCRGRYPHQLSGGQQQRTALARILVSEPELVLLDEPFSALDAYLRETLQTQVHKILRDFGKDVLLVSHNRDEVYYLCENVAAMAEGRILKLDKTKELFADPGSRTAAILSGCKNVVEAKRTGEFEVEVPDWGIRLQTGQRVAEDLCAIGIRAHYFHPRTRLNRYPVEFSARREEPFETRILFRYATQRPGTPDIWWRLPKDRAGEAFPEMLGIAPQNILLLYPEERADEGFDAGRRV